MNPIKLLPNSPFTLAYQGTRPTLKGDLLRSEPGSAVVGRVTLGGQAQLEPFAVLRADGHVVNVGKEFYLGLHSSVHIAHDLYGATVGDRVSVGANSVVHACSVGDDCVVQDSVQVLDGASVGNGSVIAAGSVVFPRSVLPSGHWCEGSPAVAVRPVDSVELQALHRRMRTNVRSGLLLETAQSSDSIIINGAAGSYVAATVTGAGEIRLAESASLWFGCVVEATSLGVTIGRGANVQDNTVLRSSARAVTIGQGSTIGHNVLLHDCVIADLVLVGMGSSIAPGTMVQENVLIAAGSTTTPGQVLDSGWLWAGRPARPLRRLEERMVKLIRDAAAVYCEYALEFGANQTVALKAMAEQPTWNNFVRQ
ncbi:MAG: gamma carbonic anhydrase family protein [Betaproteobacteria bacterium]|nr:gamma carbonic anhydrase family protein [Betaproteobacteria bacterium]